MIRFLVGLLLALFLLGLAGISGVLLVPVAGILKGISALFSFLFALLVFMIWPTLILIAIVFLVFVFPLKIFQNRE